MVHCDTTAYNNMGNFTLLSVCRHARYIDFYWNGTYAILRIGKTSYVGSDAYLNTFYYIVIALSFRRCNFTLSIDYFY